MRGTQDPTCVWVRRDLPACLPVGQDSPRCGRTLVVLTTALTVGVFISCTSPTEPVRLPVSLQTARLYSGPLPPVSVSTAHDTVRISGAITMNVPCYAFDATAWWQRDTLLVTLAARGTSDICTQVLAAFSYTITVAGVGAGSLPIRLVYDRYGLPQYLEVALEQTVTVP